MLQENYLFGDTIARNIVFGEDEPDMDRVLWATRMAGVQESIERFPLAKYRELVRSLRESMATTGIRVVTLKKELVRSESDELSVTAPCSGMIIRLQIKGAEAVVQDGDILGELACADAPLRAELTVPQSGVGLIKLGQGVKLLYDAFPHQRYGVKYGTVRWVSPASVIVKDSHVFRVFADIEDQTVLVKGDSRPLMAGMGGRADIVIGRRSLLSYAFEPIRQLKESLIDLPDQQAIAKTQDSAREDR